MHALCQIKVSLIGRMQDWQTHFAAIKFIDNPCIDANHWTLRQTWAGIFDTLGGR